MAQPINVEPIVSSELRQRILDAATASFADKGFAGTVMREVASAAGCTKPALYYYFTNKEALFLAVVRAENERVTQFLEASLVDSGSVQQRMRQGLSSYFEHIAAHPQGLAMLLRAETFREEGQPAIDFGHLRDAHVERTVALLASGIPLGEIRKDLNLSEAAFMLVSMVELRCRLFLFEGRPLPKPAALVDLFMRGVGET